MAENMTQRQFARTISYDKSRVLDGSIPPTFAFVCSARGWRLQPHRLPPTAITRLCPPLTTLTTTLLSLTPVHQLSPTVYFGSLDHLRAPTVTLVGSSHPLLFYWEWPPPLPHTQPLLNPKGGRHVQAMSHTVAHELLLLRFYQFTNSREYPTTNNKRVCICLKIVWEPSHILSKVFMLAPLLPHAGKLLVSGSQTD